MTPRAIVGLEVTSETIGLKGVAKDNTESDNSIAFLHIKGEGGWSGSSKVLYHSWKIFTPLEKIHPWKKINSWKISTPGKFPPLVQWRVSSIMRTNGTPHQPHCCFLHSCLFNLGDTSFVICRIKGCFSLQ